MIAITGGGTGGHLSIAKVLSKELNSRGFKTIFIGSTNGQDKAWFENDESFEFRYFLPSRGVVNKKFFGKILSLINIFALSFRALRIFKKHDICAVISVGGYSSAAASFAAIISRKKFFIHEQNAASGALNSLLKPFCDKFFSSYQKDRYDYPVAAKFFETARNREKIKTILFLGGSQGARFINELALKIAPNLSAKDVKIIHQCGVKDFELVSEAYKKMSIDAEIFAFSGEIEKYMNEADLCVSRSGASTLWELCANRLPSVFIPYPYAAKNHQFFNAKFLLDKGLARIYKQNEVNSDKFVDEILNLDVKMISTGLKGEIAIDGSKKIIDDILEITKF